MAIIQPTASQRANYKWIALGIAATSTILGTSDFSIILIALPTLTTEFDTGTGTVVWVSLAFQLVTLGLVLPAGRFGDLIGKRRVFISGMLIYSSGMLLAGLAPTIESLIGARMVQSVGAAMTNALASAIVTSAFPRRDRGKALGTLMSSAGIGMMIGPSLGGLLLGTLGWRYIFLLRVPFALLAFLVAFRYLAEDPRSDSETSRRFDYTGAVLIFLVATAFAVGINRGSREGFDSPIAQVLLAACAALIVVFVVFELRSRSPVVDLRLFANRALGIGSGLMVALTTTVSSMSFLMPFYLMLGLGLSPTSTGFVLLAGPAVTIVGSPIAGRLSDTVGPRVLTPLGLAIVSASLFTLSTLPVAAPTYQVVLLLGTTFAGTSLFNTPNQSAIMGAAPAERLGTVSALIPTLRNIGLIVGIATAEALFVATSGITGEAPEGLSLSLEQRELVVRGVSVTLRLFGTVAAVGAVVAVFRGNEARQARPAG